MSKEREAFEQALVNQKNVPINNLHVCTIFDAEKNKYSPSDVCDPREDFIVDWINSSWSIWQAAKAQAVPEGFILVPVETLNEALSWANCASSESWTDAQREEIDKHYEVIESAMNEAHHPSSTPDCPDEP